MADGRHFKASPNGASIPLLPDSYKENKPLAHTDKVQGAINSEAKSASSSNATKPPAHSTPTPAQVIDPAELRQHAERIASAAKHLNDLREAWLNPPEWTQRVPEVIPLGMSTSPYPDRIEPKPGISEADRKALQKRTLTNLYNARPAWLTLAHQQLDAAVGTAYGWADYTPAMPDDEVLKRLLALNLACSVTISVPPKPHTP